MKKINRREMMKLVSVSVAAAAIGLNTVSAQEKKTAPSGADNWYVSTQSDASVVKFKNAYGMTVAATLIVPKNLDRSRRHRAVVLSHPFAAVRQQAAMLYAMKLSEYGLVTLAFDQTFWGESGGEPRGAVLPDVYAENFSAAVDYVGTLSFVDRNRIGALGICASGGFVLAAAKTDPRIKAVVTSSMYDMGEYYRTGVNGDRAKATLTQDLNRSASARWEAVDTGKTVYAAGQQDPSFVEAPESNDFYRTSRGAYPKNDRRTSPVTYARFLNFYPLRDLDLIAPRPILFVVGEKAPTKCYTDTAFRQAAEPKEMLVVKGANRIDLYDRTDLIPFESIASFFRKNL